MPIEFFCPGCGKQMRAPETAAGRKGQCPHCGTKVQIPASSIASSGASGGGGGGTGGGQPKPAAAASGPIQFSCGSCGKTLKVPAANAGKKGKCPQCGAVMTIPAPSRAAKWKGAPAAPDSGGQPAGAPASTAPIQFTCPGCSRTVRVAGSAAGKRGKCPHCQTVFQIPAARPTTPAPGGTGLQPLDSGAGGLTPLGSGLDPFGGGGLEPLGGGLGGGGLDPFGGGGLDPLGGASDPFAAGSFGGAADNPFGGAAAGGGTAWGAAPQGAVNPYSAPMAGAAAKPRTSGKSDKRKGLPWDREMSASTFTSTVSEIISSPSEAFKSMKRYGGFGGPLLFSLLGGSIGGLVAAALQGGIVYFDPTDQYADEIQAAFAIGMFFYVLIATLVGASVGVFFQAGILHLPLKMMGTKQPYETTFRVLAYMNGSIALLQLIPCFGGCVALVYAIIITISGMAAAHGISTGKAFGAWLLSIVMVGTVCVGGVLVFGGILSMVGAPAPQ